MTATDYDAVLYPARPFVQTHPDRLATLGRLFGLSPAPPARCRVLELGCGAGGNLVPMAAALPGSSFVGIDTAAVPIARARARAERLGLENLRLEAIGIEDFAAAAGSFDYVIAHGVFSWVPEPVRAALLALSAHVLADDGIAYVSYNALPGGHLRRMLRDALAVRLPEIEDPAQRIAAARGVLAELVAAHDADPGLAPTLARAAREVIGNDDAFLFHDVLAEVNEPFHLHELLGRARGLRFLTEAQLSETRIDGLPDVVREPLAAMEDPVRREQALDVVKERRFRQTLLCRADRTITREPRAERLEGLAVSGALRIEEDGPRVGFLGPGTARVDSDHPLVVRTLRAVAESWPSPVWISALGAEAEQPRIRAILLGCFAANLVRLHVEPPFVATQAGERPCVSAVARLEAAEGLPLTTPRHTAFALDDPLLARLVGLLDGTRDRTALRAQAQTGSATLDAALDRLAAAGLLLPGG